MISRLASPLAAACVLSLCLGCLPGLPDDARRYIEIPAEPWGLPWLLQCHGPDPAVAVRFELVERFGPTHGRVRITATLENLGDAAWSSDENQQTAHFYEDSALLETRNFQTLTLDEKVEIIYEREWWTSDEFRPSKYRFELWYDPDIAVDNNPLNDDCRSNNNVAERLTAEIDALFD